MTLSTALKAYVSKRGEAAHLGGLPGRKHKLAPQVAILEVGCHQSLCLLHRMKRDSSPGNPDWQGCHLASNHLLACANQGFLGRFFYKVDKSGA